MIDLSTCFSGVGATACGQRLLGSAPAAELLRIASDVPSVVTFAETSHSEPTVDTARTTPRNPACHPLNFVTESCHLARSLTQPVPGTHDHSHCALGHRSGRGCNLPARAVWLHFIVSCCTWWSSSCSKAEPSTLAASNPSGQPSCLDSEAACCTGSETQAARCTSKSTPDHGMSHLGRKGGDLPAAAPHNFVPGAGPSQVDTPGHSSESADERSRFLCFLLDLAYFPGSRVSCPNFLCRSILANDVQCSQRCDEASLCLADFGVQLQEFPLADKLGVVLIIRP
mmetsp:Transcript_35202/g.76173  ORF Transcript_35202/g.76173 Transcript_35202/m.76173 type:complete len:284 (+) Transcript_35202:269-1120(+)